MMQNCAWLKKMKIRRYNSFTSLLLLSPEVCSTEKVRAEIIYICNTNFGERALCWTCPCWSKQNTVNHLFSHARNFYESRNRFVVNVFGANQSSNVCGIPYYFLENLVLIAKWASLFPVNDKINLMRIQLVYRICYLCNIYLPFWSVGVVLTDVGVFILIVITVLCCIFWYLYMLLL